MLIKAFVVGGLICVIGQLLIDKTKMMSARILVLYVCLGCILGGLGIYQKLEEFAGAGATVPLTGFGFRLAEGVDQIIRQYFHNLPAAILSDSDFSNARFVRNLFERTWSKSVMRAQLDGTDPRTIRAADFEAAAGEDVKSIGRKQQNKRPHPGFRLGMV